MKYFSLILSFIIIVSIKHSSCDEIPINLEEEAKTITVHSDVCYIETNLKNKNGQILIDIRTPKPKNSSTVTFSYRLAPDTKDVDKGEFKTDYSLTRDEKNGQINYNILYGVSSDDKVNILKIVGFKKYQPASISAKFISNKFIIIVVVVAAVVLLFIIIGVIVCICKGICKCCCC